MSQYQNAKALAELSLGKSTTYESEYNPNLLQGVPRSLNRDELAINNNSLPFVGEDVWYGYEISWLNNKGKPIVATAEFRVPCESEFIIESKSFKLYLNSFNQTHFDSKQVVEQLLIKDLSAITKKTITVNILEVTNCSALDITYLPATCIDELDISIDNYDFNAELLKANNKTKKPISENLVSHLLKSNCLITNQPDWASIYIDYQGQAICHESLLRYLISFRQHNEFHEQCVERIFCDLQNTFDLSKLTVYARYTRRGGLDINPFRSTHLTTAPFARTHRQ